VAMPQASTNFGAEAGVFWMTLYPFSMHFFAAAIRLHARGDRPSGDARQKPRFDQAIHFPPAKTIPATAAYRVSLPRQRKRSDN
ncbi:MAG: hypothetical protein WCY68_09285, partial [Desulfuromonadales bacterium]